jgi:hypothetical protein
MRYHSRFFGFHMNKIPNPAVKYSVIVLVASQLLASIFYARTCYDLVKTGAAPVLAAALWLPASLCLYIAAVLLAVTRTHGHRLFLFAGFGLALSVPLWGWPYPWTVVAAFGSAMGYIGWWTALRRARHERAI